MYRVRWVHITLYLIGYITRYLSLYPRVRRRIATRFPRGIVPRVACRSIPVPYRREGRLLGVPGG